jgi:hypothetical protein
MSVRLRALTTSLALLAVAFGYVLTQGRVERPAAPPRPASVAAASGVRAPRPLPSAQEILDRGVLLSLTAEQKRSLEALARGWTDESTRLEAELQAATAEFSRFMSEAQGSRRTSLQEIQRQSAGAGELGARLRERRRLHGEAAAGLLADWQRAKLVQGTGQSLREMTDEVRAKRAR